MLQCEKCKQSKVIKAQKVVREAREVYQLLDEFFCGFPRANSIGYHVAFKILTALSCFLLVSAVAGSGLASIYLLYPDFCSADIPAL
jgi:hypothetical protein